MRELLEAMELGAPGPPTSGGGGGPAGDDNGQDMQYSFRLMVRSARQCGQSLPTLDRVAYADCI